MYDNDYMASFNGHIHPNYNFYHMFTKIKDLDNISINEL
jgi:hypothetical protein